MSSSTSTVISTHPSSSSPSLSTLSLDYLSLRTIHISFKPTPLKSHKLRLFNYQPFSRSYNFAASTVAFADGLETEEEEEEEIEDETETETETEAESEGLDDEDEGVVSQEAEERRLYVGNLPYSMTSKQLAEIFAQAGNVITVEIIYDRVTDRSRGFAFVTMKSVDEANEAIRMFDGSQVGGRTVRVNIPEVPKGGEKEVMREKIKKSYEGYVDSPHKIYAGNLHWNLTSQGLKEAFASQPGLVSAKVVYDRDSGRSRGFGFVTFGSAEELQSALNAVNGVVVEGRPLRLNLAEQKVPVSPPLAAENNSENVLSESLAEQKAPVSPPLAAENNSENVLNESLTENNSENVLKENEVTSSGGI